MSRGRGRIVAGTSAKKHRNERRQRRFEAQFERHVDKLTGPGRLTDPDGLAALADQHRQQKGTQDD